VVEATNRMQGPLAGLLLQMLGAEVVRVEPPGGDAGRMVPPAAGHVGSFFLCYNRGKSTVEIDLSRASGRDELRDLLATGDAFVHNWRPGKAQEWGLDPAALGATHPRLVTAEASGWGDVAENAGLIGTDFLVQAYAGYGDTLNPEGEPPLTSRALLTDCMGALVTCEGVLAGLYRRETTGRAPAVRTSLLQGAIAAQAHVLAAMASGKEGRRCRGRPRWGPLDVPVETADGWLALSVDGDTALAAACRACAAEDGLPSRSGEALAARLRQGSAAGWSEVLGTAGVPCATVTADLSALPHDPRFSVLFEHLAGTCRAPASPWTITP
jgi:crotonobetainyl-CoA:carnitine CoA-transferase CaiB-like acyl-CoA transferase